MVLPLWLHLWALKMSWPSRKRLSGAAYKKLREDKDAIVKRQTGSLTKYLKLDVKSTSSLQNSSLASSMRPSAKCATDSATIISDNHQVPVMDDNESNPSDCTINVEKDDIHAEVEEEGLTPMSNSTHSFGENNPSLTPTDDPYTWTNIDDNLRVLLVSKKPLQVKQYNFPQDSSGRRFTSKCYSRRFQNGELCERSWLLYSKHNDSVYCFCCKLFNKSGLHLGLASGQGTKDWKNIYSLLMMHEKSAAHILHFSKWQELQIRLKLTTTIDAVHQRQIDEETQHWRALLTRLCAIIRCLAVQNLALRGSTSILFAPNNGNFLKIVELFGLFDNVIKNHINRITDKESTVHYLGKDIQNEIINLMSDQIRKNILISLKIAKYFSIILDCTSDVSHREQMSIIVRFVTMPPNYGEVKIEERFLGFLDVHDKTGEGLSEQFLNQLEKLNIDMRDMRGQSYDNGANMRGKHTGVQKHILNKNSRAFYVPCSSHSLNLVVNDAAKSNIATVSFFGVIQQLYLFFSSSTDRWSVLTKFVTSLTLKKVCNTRWESRIDSIRPIRYQLGEIYDALISIKENIRLSGTHGTQTRADASALAKSICSFSFVCSLVIWYDILSKINIVSKLLQKINFDIKMATEAIDEVLKFLRNYRDNGFIGVMCQAKELADLLEIEATFPQEHEVRRRKTTQQFDYESRDEAITDPKTKFRIEFFNVIVDTAINSLTERFEQLQHHSSYFKFLYDIKALNTYSESDLLKCCKNLETVLTSNNTFDIESIDLCCELQSLCTILDCTSGPLESLNFICNRQLNEIYPNIVIALRILLTLPVSVASAERSFSKLKLIKNYVRATMSEERLVGLSMISIESEIAYGLNLEDIVSEFASSKARKTKL